MVRHAPIHRRSGHSDIAICCGRNVRGSSPSTSVVPLSNQVTTLNHKRFKGFKMFSDGYLALSCDRGGIERTHQCAGVLLQNVTVDILDSVTGPMITWIVRATSRTAKQAGLDLRLRPACARVKTHGRNALLGE